MSPFLFPSVMRPRDLPIARLSGKQHLDSAKIGRTATCISKLNPVYGCMIYISHLNTTCYQLSFKLVQL